MHLSRNLVLEKVIGGIRGLLSRPFFARCGFPVVIGHNVRFIASKDVEIGDQVRIRHGAQINRHVKLGNQVYIGRFCDVGTNVEIQDNVALADYVCILGNTHDCSDPKQRSGKLYSPGQKVIGKGAWIGYRAIILPQVRRIGTGAVVGAGSVVTKDVPDHCIVVGNPARVLEKKLPVEIPNQTQ